MIIPTKEYVTSFLKMIDFPGVAVWNYTTKYVHPFCGRKTYFSRTEPSVIPRHPTLFKMVNKLLVPPAPKEAHDLIIYTSRSKERGLGRRVLNEDEVIKTISSWIERNKLPQKLFVWEDGAHTLPETLSTFNRSKMVIGMFGGNMDNILFSPSNDCTIIEFVPSLITHGMPHAGEKPLINSILHIAISIHANYIPIIMDGMKRKDDRDIPIEKLKGALDRALEYLQA